MSHWRDDKMPFFPFFLRPQTLRKLEINTLKCDIFHFSQSRSDQGGGGNPNFDWVLTLSKKIGRRGLAQIQICFVSLFPKYVLYSKFMLGALNWYSSLLNHYNGLVDAVLCSAVMFLTDLPRRLWSTYLHQQCTVIYVIFVFASGRH